MHTVRKTKQISDDQEVFQVGYVCPITGQFSGIKSFTEDYEEPGAPFDQATALCCELNGGVSREQTRALWMIRSELLQFRNMVEKELWRRNNP